MKKKILTLTIMTACVAMVAAFSSPASAAVSGVCSGCHTMHNSEGGSSVTYGDAGTLQADGTAGGPHLTKGTCQGCHRGMVGSAPNIFTAVANDMTAAGTFDATTIANAITKRHDVTDVFAADTNFTTTPGAKTASLGLDATPAALTCAGTTGCHGDHAAGKTTSALGIAGFHHASTAYRFLQTKAGVAISGKGAALWEKTTTGPGSATLHNVYSSDSSAGISVFCGECHGDFHGSGTDTDVWSAADSAWIRHPTDQLLTGLNSWATNSNSVDIISTSAFQKTPVGFDNIDALLTTVTTGYDKTLAKVICMSCHRAHGTAEADLLRFTYADSSAGGSGTTGCLNCHVVQR